MGSEDEGDRYEPPPFEFEDVWPDEWPLRIPCDP